MESFLPLIPWHARGFAVQTLPIRSDFEQELNLGEEETRKQPARQDPEKPS